MAFASKNMTIQDNATKQNVDFTVRAQYIKDFSFENPRAPYSFLKEPQIAIDLEVAVNQLEKSTYEVALKLRAEGKSEEDTVFILELDYAGLFIIENEELSSSLKEAALSINCPNLLFPYARHLVSNITRDAGYPPLMIAPIDFALLYEQRNKPQSS